MNTRELKSHKLKTKVAGLLAVSEIGSFYSYYYTFVQ